MLSTLKIWHDITKHIGRRGFSSAFQPLYKNKVFPPGKIIFSEWYSKELHFVADLFESGNSMSFTQLQTFFGFLQVRPFVKSDFIDQPIQKN